MASLTDRLTRLAQSPQARRLIDHAREQAAKPENRERVGQLARSPQAQRLINLARDQAAKPENREKVERLVQRVRNRSTR